jgi:hypothetical protein
MDGGRPGVGALDLRSQLRLIEREAAMRGLVLKMREQIVSDRGDPAPEAAQLVATIEAAWAATDGDVARHAHVAQITSAIAKNAADRTGPVVVSRTAWVLLKSYAFTGRVPERESQLAPARTRRGAR